MTRTTHWLIAIGALLALAGGCGIGDAQARLRTAVDAKNEELSACYAGALERNRNAAGTIRATLHVEDDVGRVNQVEIEQSDLTDQAFQACMTDSLQSIQLEEAPAANLEVKYTFQFTPQD